MARRRQRQREDQADLDRQEDRNRYARSLRAADVARPGALTLDTYLSRPGVESELGAATLRDIGSAAVPDATSNLSFTPEAGRRYFQTATGPVVDREAAAKETMAPYLERIQATAQARSAYPTASDQAATARTSAAAEKAKARHQTAEQFRAEHTDLRGLSDDEIVIRLGAGRSAKVFANANPAPRRTTGSTTRDRNLTALQREAQRAQGRLSALERDPGAAPNDAQHAHWLEQMRVAQAAFDSATARVNRVLQGRVPAGRTPAPASGRAPLPAPPPLP